MAWPGVSHKPLPGSSPVITGFQIYGETNAWDVDFKLHAPKQTTIECVIKGSKIERLKATP